MKTNTEIKKFCQDKCTHTDCAGKCLKLAKRNHTFCGIIIVNKGRYYCTYKEISPEPEGQAEKEGTQ